jgi:DNA-nicking Smr family endonuclease
MLLQCIKDNYKELLLITGKGIHSNTEKNVYTSKQLSKLRYSIPEFLKSHEEISKCIISVTEADLNDGGEGAILVTLKSL